MPDSRDSPDYVKVMQNQIGKAFKAVPDSKICMQYM